LWQTLRTVRRRPYPFCRVLGHRGGAAEHQSAAIPVVTSHFIFICTFHSLNSQLPVYNLQVASVIALFAKAPVAGRVKTRLCPPLTPQEAADIHLQFTTLMMKKLSSFEAVASIELHTDVVTDAWMRREGCTAFAM
jgi:hypothetical protein